MTEIDKRIKVARPSFKKVSPLVYRICQGFAMTNLAIAYFLFFIAGDRTTDSLPLFGSLISFEAYSLVFLALTFGMVWGLATNSWKTIRSFLIAGLLTKTFWALSLIVLLVQGNDVFHLTVLWLMLAYVQAWCVVHFLPIIGWNGLDETVGAKDPERQKIS